MSEETKFVWVVTTFMNAARLYIERYQLVKLNPKGGATVMKRGSEVVIRSAQGKRFFTDEAKFLAYCRKWAEVELEHARGRVAALEEALKQPVAGQFIEEVSAEPYPVHKNLKV